MKMILICIYSFVTHTAANSGLESIKCIYRPPIQFANLLSISLLYNPVEALREVKCEG